MVAERDTQTLVLGCQSIRSSLYGRGLPCSCGRWGQTVQGRTPYAGMKKLFQESENFAKPEYIHGHMFGGLCILAGNVRSWACIPLSIRLHNGLQATRGWKGASVCGASHVVQMVEDAYHVAPTFGSSLLLLLKNSGFLMTVGRFAWKSLQK